MTDARAAILNRVDRCSNSSLNAQAAAERLALLIDSPHARLVHDDPVEAFAKRISAGNVIGTSVSRLQSINQVPTEIAAYLDQRPDFVSADAEGKRSVYAQQHPRFAGIDWLTLENLGPEIDGAQDNLVAISYADFGIAETGSVVFHSGSDSPVLLNFLCSKLFIVVSADNILALMDDYAAKQQGQSNPRNTIWITGASGTTDIEGVLVRGAHGPDEVHIFICSEF